MPIVVWRTPRPDALERRLAETQVAAQAGRRHAESGAGTGRGVPATLRIVEGSSDLLLFAHDADDSPGGLDLDVSVLGLGVATVDRERWGPSADLEDDELLGARVARLDGALALDGQLGPQPDRALALAREALPDVLVTLLEPGTEGRLAAGLARRGEGLLVVYVAGEPASAVGRRLADGPFGAEALVSDARQGPFLIVASGLLQPGRAGTIGGDRSSR